MWNEILWQVAFSDSDSELSETDEEYTARLLEVVEEGSVEWLWVVLGLHLVFPNSV